MGSSLAELGFALNTAVHSSLGISPSFMNFDRNPTPSILLRSHLENPQQILPPDLEKWKTRSSRLPALHDLVRRQLDKATATQAKYYNRKRREVYYQVGDLQGDDQGCGSWIWLKLQEVLLYDK